MPLSDWQREGRLRVHKTSPQEVANLLQVVDRDLADASVRELSADRRFSIAYNASLQLATVALYAAGYRSVGAGHHWITLTALPEVKGSEAQSRADFLNACRLKRNRTDYDRAGIISDAEANEILMEAQAFKADLLEWLRQFHPHLAPTS